MVAPLGAHLPSALPLWLTRIYLLSEGSALTVLLTSPLPVILPSFTVCNLRSHLSQRTSSSFSELVSVSTATNPLG